MSVVTLHHVVNKPLRPVYDSLLDFQQFGQLHPYMKSVEIISQSVNEVKCVVHEELKLWGFIPLAPCYTVTVTEIEKDRQIRYWSEVKKGLFLTIDFTVTTDDQQTQTRVREQITLKGNPWVHPVFIPLLKKSHQHIFKNLSQ